MRWLWLGLSVSLLASPTVGATLISSAVCARESGLTAEQISQYRSKLASAQASREILAGRGTCLQVYGVDLQARSDEQELILGRDRRLEQDLIRDSEVLEQEKAGFEREVASEDSSLILKKKELETILSRIAEQKARLEKCHIGLFLLGASSACDLGDLILKETGLMRNLQKDVQAAETRVENAAKGVREMQARLDDSRKSLVQTQMKMENTRAAIDQTEADIVKTKKIHASLNSTLQGYNILLDSFASTLDEATAVDANSERARRIDQLSSALDQLTASGLSLIEAADSALPDDAKRRCQQH